MFQHIKKQEYESKLSPFQGHVVTNSRAMVRFKVGTARKRTGKSPKGIYNRLSLSLSLSLSLCVWGTFMFVQDLTQHRDSSGMCPTASWQNLRENLLTTTGHDDDLAKRLETADKLALVESLSLLS